MKIKFYSAANLPINKLLKLYNLTIAVRFVFQELTTSFFRWMLVLGINNRIWSDRFSEVIDVNNKNTSKNVIFVIIGIF